MRHREQLRFALLAILVATQLAACGDPCGNDVYTTMPSPDGKFIAVLFNRDCGATTDFSSQISILHKNENLSGSGNAFIADANHGAADIGAWGGPNVAMRWVSSQGLTVQYATGTRIFKSEEKVGDVTIAYQAGDIS